MILVGMTVGDTLVLGFLVGTSCIKVVDKISLMVLPENMASSGSLGHPGKGLFVLCSWCSSSSSDSEAIGDFWGHSTFPELTLPLLLNSSSLKILVAMSNACPTCAGCI
jgi:hypothetical protein